MKEDASNVVKKAILPISVQGPLKDNKCQTLAQVVEVVVEVRAVAEILDHDHDYFIIRILKFEKCKRFIIINLLRTLYNIFIILIKIKPLKFINL